MPFSVVADAADGRAVAAAFAVCFNCLSMSKNYIVKYISRKNKLNVLN